MTHKTHSLPAANERGVSLIELMIALVVIAVGVMAVFQLFPTGMKSFSDDRSFSKATYYAQQELERLSGLAYGDLDLYVGTHPSNGTETIAGGFQRSYVVSMLSGEMENMKKVVVTVTWSGGTQSTHAVTYVRR